MPFSRKVNFAGKCGSSRDPPGVTRARSPGRGGTGRRKVGTARNVALGVGIGAVCSPEPLTLWNSQSCPSWSRAWTCCPHVKPRLWGFDLVTVAGEEKLQLWCTLWSLHCALTNLDDAFPPEPVLNPSPQPAALPCLQAPFGCCCWGLVLFSEAPLKSGLP